LFGIVTPTGRGELVVGCAGSVHGWLETIGTACPLVATSVDQKRWSVDNDGIVPTPVKWMATVAGGASEAYLRSASPTTCASFSPRT
jgi:hypothetical protein